MFIKLKVTTEAKVEKIVKKSDDAFIVSVRSPAERGEANDRVLELFELLRHRFPGRSMKIVSGHHRSSKMIEVR